MKVNGVNFNVEIQPDIDSAIDAARQICSLGDKINVTETQIPECVDGVVRLIRETYTKIVLETQANTSEESLSSVVEPTT